MSWYYKQSFISPQEIYAEVKEELRSYFEAGMVDDLLFTKWTSHCLRRFRKSALPIQAATLFIDDFTAKLPPDFIAVREAWICATITSDEFRNTGSYYRLATIVVDSTADSCQEIECNPPCQTNCDPCAEANTYQVTYKTDLFQTATLKVSHLLKPGNISASQNCDFECRNMTSSSQDTFDIKDDKFITNFRCGDVYFLYYASETDEDGYQLIPDNFYFGEYLKAYLKYKIFEQLWNQVTDETFNQIQAKYQVYSQKKDETFVMAEQEFRSQTLQQKINAISANRRRMNKYRIR